MRTIARLCLVTGATGYIGGGLVPELLAAGHRVRVLTRAPEKLRDHPWAGRVEILAADAGDTEAVTRACSGVQVGYYLIHALGSGSSFEDTDRRTAQAVAAAVRKAGVERLVYLGGLDPPEEDVSRPALAALPRRPPASRAGAPHAGRRPTRVSRAVVG